MIWFAVLLLPNTSLRLPRPITYIGVVSYPLYLLHSNMGFSLIRELRPFVADDHFRVLAVTLLMIALAGLVSFLVENRFRKNVEAALRWPIDAVKRRLPRRALGVEPPHTASGSADGVLHGAEVELVLDDGAGERLVRS